MKEPFVSVIVPVYKVEDYLDECVSSIINQKYKKFELILVDDGSPDNCGKMCDKYAEKYCFVKVVHKENGGLSSARNAGIDIATGDFIAFIDSDDFINDEYLSVMVELASKYNADIVCCNFIESENFTGWTRSDNVTVRYGEDIINNRFVNDKIVTVAWNKLYKSDLFLKTGLRYPEGKIHEDNFLTPKILYHSKCMVFTEDNLYFYRVRAGSIMTCGFSPKNMDKIEAIEENLKFYTEINKPKLFYIELDGYIRNLMKMYLLLKKQKYDKNLEYQKDIYKKLLKTIKKIKFDNNISLKLKIKAALFILRNRA